MGYIKLVIILVCAVVAKGSDEDRSSDLESKVELLISKIAKLEEENVQIKTREFDSSNYLAFDCFRNSDLATYGVITFDDCEGMKLSTLLIKHSDTDHQSWNLGITVMGVFIILLCNVLMLELRNMKFPPLWPCSPQLTTLQMYRFSSFIRVEC